MTQEERRDLTNRFRITRELIKGEKTQREIAKTLNVSIANITRGSNFLKTIPKDFREYVKNKIGKT
jgi:TrpR family trp operon transcriptional repressor